MAPGSSVSVRCLHAVLASGAMPDPWYSLQRQPSDRRQDGLICEGPDSVADPLRGHTLHTHLQAGVGVAVPFIPVEEALRLLADVSDDACSVISR
jgi:hypothetical protein